MTLITLATKKRFLELIQQQTVKAPRFNSPTLLTLPADILRMLFNDGFLDAASRETARFVCTRLRDLVLSHHPTAVNFASKAALLGLDKLLLWSLENGCNPNERTCSLVALGGNLPLLSNVAENDPPGGRPE